MSDDSIDGISSIPLRWCNTHQALFPFLDVPGEELCTEKLNNLNNLKTACEVYHLFYNPPPEDNKDLDL